MSEVLGADFREVIRGRVCVDGVLYSHPRLSDFEGKEVPIKDYSGALYAGLGQNNPWGGYFDSVFLTRVCDTSPVVHSAVGIWYSDGVPEPGRFFVVIRSCPESYGVFCRTKDGEYFYECNSGIFECEQPIDAAALSTWLYGNKHYPDTRWTYVPDEVCDFGEVWE